MKEARDIHAYDDIINLPHHRSAVHPQMPVYDRAAQFSPFAALTGYEAAIQETARLTERRVELDEYEKERLNKTLQRLAAGQGTKTEAEVTYFRPDEKKEGGAYVTLRGFVKKIDGFEGTLAFADGTVVPICQIAALELGPFSP